jgi:hypothetical protein
MRHSGPLMQLLQEEAPIFAYKRSEEIKVLSKMGSMSLPQSEHSIRKVSDFSEDGRKYSVNYNPNRKRVDVYSSDMKKVGIGNPIIFKEEPIPKTEAMFYAVYSSESKKGFFGGILGELAYVMIPASAGKFENHKFVLKTSYEDMKNYPVAFLNLGR